MPIESVSHVSELEPKRQRLTFSTDRYDQTPGVFDGDLWTVPVRTRQEKLVLMQALVRQPPLSPESDNKPRSIIIGMGGGVSGAKENAGILTRLEKAFASSQVGLERLIFVSHPSGTARTQAQIDTHNLRQSAELVMHTAQAITPLPDLRLILWGMSAGGAIMIEAARICEEQNIPYTLVIIDPAGMSDHPNLEKELAVGTPRDILLHTQLNSQRRHDSEGAPIREWWERIREARDEMLSSMTMPGGAPQSLMDSISEMAYRGKQRLDGLAQELGLPKSVGGALPAAHLLKTDSTKEAREALKAQVILVSPVFAKAVNLFISHLGFTPQILDALWGFHETRRLGYLLNLAKTLRKQYPHASLKSIVTLARAMRSEEYLDNLLQFIAYGLFPHAKVETLAFPTGLHSGILRSDAVNTIVKKITSDQC
ncbi:hypothetical protein HY408_01015 [Candidatus Gottesmanbacteria bacterium]|nr:hypothetical protein [Candidatus Gottesmanbacteria bacterium]